MIQGKKLTATNCQDIVQDWKNGVTIADISRKFNVNQKTIHSLLTGVTYKGQYKIKEIDDRSAGRRIIMTINDIPVEFKSVRELSKVLGLSESAVSNIAAGRHPIPTITSINYK